MREMGERCQRCRGREEREMPEMPEMPEERGRVRKGRKASRRRVEVGPSLALA
jgi:hypothetical protein